MIIFIKIIIYIPLPKKTSVSFISLEAFLKSLPFHSTRRIFYFFYLSPIIIFFLTEICRPPANRHQIF